MAPLGPFGRDRRVLVGVSGGADSMALAFLLGRWGAPLACIVDHGLRAGSNAEAAQAASRLTALGIPAKVVRAEIAEGTAMAERARRARYELLRGACREAGCADLLVAHHAADQAETIQMRLAAGSGAAGLAGMAAITYSQAARLLRPLLSIGPARLRATLIRAGVEWAEDPTNQDRRTLRARLRAGMDRAACAEALSTAALHGPARQEAEQLAANELANVAITPGGFAHVPGTLGGEALSALVWTLSGRAYPPPPAMLQAGLSARTFHGVVIRPAGSFGPGWLMAREPAAVAPPAPARAGTKWDGRFILLDNAAGATIGALGPDAARFRRDSKLPSMVLRGLPALRRGDELIVVPHLAFPDAVACRSLDLRFCPARPAAGAPFFLTSA